MLYATKEEAASILDWARERELTGNNFVWIVTQSVIGESKNGVAQTKPQFPVGMLGIIYHLLDSPTLCRLSTQQNKSKVWKCMRSCEFNAHSNFAIKAMNLLSQSFESS